MFIKQSGVKSQPLEFRLRASFGTEAVLMLTISQRVWE